jgi:hypothetical protein
MNTYLKVRFPVAIIALVLLAAVLCRADDAPQSPKRMENRFLFVIDTSSSMKSRTNGIEETVSGLLKTDMHGEFRKGDTLGVWTYDEKIHADFPMQVWSQDKKDAIAGDVMRYVRHQHYENRSHLDKVLTAIGKVLSQSDRLTVILIHDGSELIRGTEFDGDINDLQKKYSRQFRSAHQPMVTVLSARFGQVFDYSINYPSSITIPHTAIPLAPPPETNALPVNAIAVAPVPVTNAAPAEPAPPPRRIEIIMSGTNNLTRTTPQAESPASNPSPRQGNIVMAGPAQTQTQPQPQPQPVPAPTPATPANPAPVAAEPIASTPSPPASKPEPTTPETAAITAQPEPTPVPPSAPQKPTPPPPPTQIATVTPAPESSSTPTVVPSSAPLRSPAPAPVLSPATVPLPSPTTAPVRAPSPASVPLAVVSTAQQLALFVIAVSLLTIAVVLVVFLVRRSRGNSPPSLISQSIDRGR